MVNMFHPLGSMNKTLHCKYLIIYGGPEVHALLVFKQYIFMR